MSSLAKRFVSINEDYPGDKWLEFYRNVDDGYRQWFLKEGDFQRPTYRQCQQALEHYMPEFVPIWERLLNLIDGDDLQARLLSLYCPTPYLTGCSQAVWSRYSPVLVRNYDYSPGLCEGRIQKSCWNGTQVIASTDCLWGALDGMNHHGLCVSLAFGGSDVIGEGFGIPLILRYILEYCKTTRDAVEVLCRIPCNMTYNITLLDQFFDTATVELSPIEAPKVSPAPIAVNHQGDFDMGQYAMFSNSFERKRTIIDRMYDPMVSLESFIDGFEYAPLFASDYDQNFGTLYTAVYNPSLKAMEIRWPYHTRMYQSFDYFIEQEVWVHY